MGYLFSLAEGRDRTTSALSPSEDVKEKKSGDGEGNIENVSDVSDLRRSNERSALVLYRVDSLCKSLSLHFPRTVLQAQQKIEDAIRSFADYSHLRASLKTENAFLTAIQQNREQRAVTYERELAQFRQ